MYNFELENSFFQNIIISRASKIYSQLELFIKAKHIKGDIYEFGVFKGNSLSRLILKRDIYAPKKKIFAFDTFKIINPKKNTLDFKKYKKFIKDSKSYQPSKKKIISSLKKRKMFKNVFIIEGDVINTFPHKKLSRASFVLLDLDLYEPTAHILKSIWGKLSKGGIIVLDNYKVFRGETKAVDEFLKIKKISIKNIKRHRSFYFLKK